MNACPHAGGLRLHLALACHCAAFAAALAALWSLVPAAPAYAYVDPSVMTYTIQAVAGLAVALSAVMGVAFRRTRRKIYQAFNIDENAHKIVEDPIGRIDPASPDAPSRYDAARQAASEQASACDELVSGAPRELSRKARFGIALVMSVFLAFIVFIAPALEIFGSNGDSLVFGFTVVWWIPVAFCLAFAVIASFLLSFLNKRPFYLVMTGMFGVTVAAYAQSLFMNNGMLPADGGFIGWISPYFISRMIGSGLAWIAIIAGAYLLMKRNARLFLRVASGLACAIILVQLVGVGSIALDASKTAVAEQSKPYVTKGGLLSVSQKSNVIVFVLDTFDTSFMEAIREEDPDALDEFQDFTYFRDSVGTMIPTTNAIPNMLTALKPEPGQDVREYRRTRYEKGTYLDDIQALGYSIGVYSDSLMMDFNNPADCETAAQTVNVHPVSHAPLDVWRTFIAMEQCALYREAPWVLKPAFWYYTSDINNRMIAESDSAELDDSLYELDDAAILQLVRQRGLSAVDKGEAGAFRFIHLFGPHFPYSVDENGNKVGTNQSTPLAQAKGSLKVVVEYLRRLKELGLYDSSTIIVTADHGVWFLTIDPVEEPVSPVMLAKPARTGSDASGTRAPVQISEMPVCHDDIQATVIAAMGGDSSPYGTTLFEVSDPNRVRYFDALTNSGGEGQRFIEYAIEGDVLDIANWRKTGNVWHGA